MSKYLDNTGLSRLITKVKSLIVPPPEIKTYEWTASGNTGVSIGRYKLTLKVFVCGTSYQHISVTFTIVSADGSNMGSPIFDITSYPYGGAYELINEIANKELIIPTKGSISSGGTTSTVTGHLMYRVTKISSSQVQIKRVDSFGGQPSSMETTVLGQPYLLYG